MTEDMLNSLVKYAVYFLDDLLKMHATSELQ